MAAERPGRTVGEEEVRPGPSLVCRELAGCVSRADSRRSGVEGRDAGALNESVSQRRGGSVATNRGLVEGDHEPRFGVMILRSIMEGLRACLQMSYPRARSRLKEAPLPGVGPLSWLLSS